MSDLEGKDLAIKHSDQYKAPVAHHESVTTEQFPFSGQQHLVKSDYGQKLQAEPIGKTQEVDKLGDRIHNNQQEQQQQQKRTE